jgi:hypothetical protein
MLDRSSIFDIEGVCALALGASTVYRQLVMPVNLFYSTACPYSRQQLLPFQKPHLKSLFNTSLSQCNCSNWHGHFCVHMHMSCSAHTAIIPRDCRWRHSESTGTKITQKNCTFHKDTPSCTHSIRLTLFHP